MSLASTQKRFFRLRNRRTAWNRGRGKIQYQSFPCLYTDCFAEIAFSFLGQGSVVDVMADDRADPADSDNSDPHPIALPGSGRLRLRRTLRGNSPNIAPRLSDSLWAHAGRQGNAPPAVVVLAVRCRKVLTPRHHCFLTSYGSSANTPTEAECFDWKNGFRLYLSSSHTREVVVDSVVYRAGCRDADRSGGRSVRQFQAKSNNTLGRSIQHPSVKQ